MIINGSSGNDNLLGTVDSDTLYGLEGDDILDGSLGDDVLDGGIESKNGDTARYWSAISAVIVDLSTGVVTGGAGNDTLIEIENVDGSAFADTITGDDEWNTLRGAEGNDNLYGGAGYDSLYGDEGNDSLYGGDESDVLVGGNGDDILDGGAGKNGNWDRVDYSSAGGAVFVNLLAGTATGGAGNDTLINIEDVFGSAYNDKLTGDANANSIYGWNGNDLLIGGNGSDYLDGGAGNDTLKGGQGDDILIGDNGNDHLDGGPSSKGDRADYSFASSAVVVNLLTGTATGGAGNDTLTNIEDITGSSYNDMLTGDANPNRLYGLDGNDALYGNAGDDYLDGGDGNNQLFGGDGNDWLNSSGSGKGMGNDTLDGGKGQDAAHFEAATSAVIVNLQTGTATGGAGSDTLISIEDITGSSYNDALTGDANPNRLYGSAGNDVLYGNVGDDYLDGGDGNNQLFGGDGNDWLNSSGSGKSMGNDILDGGKGQDAAHFEAATSAVIVNLQTGTATGGAGSDVLISIEDITGSSYDDVITGDANPNYLYGAAGNDVIYGGAGDDHIDGNEGDNQLFGGNGNDWLSSSNGGKGMGNDILDGGRGQDAAHFEAATSAVIVNLQTGTAPGGAGSDFLISIEDITGSSYDDVIIGDANPNYLYGAAGNDVIYGDTGDDYLDGNEGDNQLFGGDGNDWLSSSNGGKGMGNDILDGGKDQDAAHFETATSAVIVNLQTGTATGGAGNDTLIAIEDVYGSFYDDSLTGDANRNQLFGMEGDDILDGGEGDDILDGGASSKNGDRADYTTAAGAVIVNLLSGMAAGAAGDDTLIDIENAKGSAFDDILIGNAEMNLLDGGSGNDTMEGDSGDDGYVVDNAGDMVIEPFNAGIDYVNSNITYTLPLNVENLTLTGDSTINGTGNGLANFIMGNSAANHLAGGSGNDTLYGMEGNDLLIGGIGADQMAGGIGNDNYIVDDSNDLVTENNGEGIDTVKSSVTYTLPRNVENLMLTGAAAIDGTGNKQNNSITGNTADNILKGAAGNDILDGDTGNNTLTGGSGLDIFRFSTTGHIDAITDFEIADDTIQLENDIFTALTTTDILPADQFVIGTTALDANDYVIYNDITGAIFYDIDGSDSIPAVQIATVSTGLLMTHADFLVI